MFRILFVFIVLFLSAPAFGQVPIANIRPLVPNEFASWTVPGDWEHKDPLFIRIENRTETCLVIRWSGLADTPVVTAKRLVNGTEQSVITLVGTENGNASCLPAHSVAWTFAPAPGAYIEARGYGTPQTSPTTTLVNGVPMLLYGTYTIDAGGVKLNKAPVLMDCVSRLTDAGRTAYPDQEKVTFNMARCHNIR
jgi:hypothetical protein